MGLKYEEVITITSTFPSLLSLSINTIETKMNNIIKFGYTKEQILIMIKNFPFILGLNSKNIKDKIDFYRAIGIDNIILEDTRQLIQRVDLSYARYCFYKDKGIIINQDNYINLFMSQKRFIEVYEITNKGLMELHNYEDYINIKEKIKVLN